MPARFGASRPGSNYRNDRDPNGRRDASGGSGRRRRLERDPTDGRGRQEERQLCPRFLPKLSPSSTTGKEGHNCRSCCGGP